MISSYPSAPLQVTKSGLGVELKTPPRLALKLPHTKDTSS